MDSVSSNALLIDGMVPKYSSNLQIAYALVQNYFDKSEGERDDNMHFLISASPSSDLRKINYIFLL